MRAGELQKVVLAREIFVEADRPFGVVDILRRLRSAHDDARAPRRAAATTPEKTAARRAR
jgi:isochorismate synthase EntC